MRVAHFTLPFFSFHNQILFRLMWLYGLRVRGGRGAGVQNIPPRCSYIIVEMYILCIFIVGYKFIFIDSRTLCLSAALCWPRSIRAAVREHTVRSVPRGRFCCSAFNSAKDSRGGKLAAGSGLDLKIALFLRFAVRFSLVHAVSGVVFKNQILPTLSRPTRKAMLDSVSRMSSECGTEDVQEMIPVRATN